MADVLRLAALVAAYIVSIAVPLVILPWILDRRGDLPYNSVRSRLLAWSTFAALMVAVTAWGAGGLAWDAWAWALFAGVIAFATLWDIRDMKTRRIPRARHPET